MAAFPVVLDACVLFNTPVRDIVAERVGKYLKRDALG
jgi:hypothetical protein